MSSCATALPNGCSSWFPLGNAAELVAQAKQAGGKLEVIINEVPLLLVLASNGHPTGVLQARCSHYGAPLANGVVCDGRVLCPWHAAAFDSATGDIEDAPAVKPLESYHFVVENELFVGVDASENPVPRPRMKSAPESHSLRTVLVVGGGAAGFVAVQTLVEESNRESVRIVFVCAEVSLPYDRPKLSKNLETRADSALLRAEDWYQTSNVEVLLGTTVTKLDTVQKLAQLDNGDSVVYNEVIVCSGARAFELPIPGHNLANIFTLRSVEDASSILAAADKAQNIAIIGSGFIGLEVASYLVKNTEAESVTVVSLDSVPLQRVFGARVGAAIQKMHEYNGVEFALERNISAFEGSEMVTGVVTDKGVVSADLVVVGVGVRLNTAFLSGIELDERDRSVKVDAHLQAAESVFAAGDIAKFPYRGNHVRIEHWDVAQNMGRIAARNALLRLSGKESVYTLSSTPFFWSVHYGKSIRYVGLATAFDDVIIDGNAEDQDSKFVAYYIENGRVNAVATLGRDPIAVAAGELMRLNKMPSVDEVRANPSMDLARLL